MRFYHDMEAVECDYTASLYCPYCHSSKIYKYVLPAHGYICAYCCMDFGKIIQMRQKNE